MLYPLNLDLSGKSCVVIGGGQVAERKVMGLVAAGAEVTVIAPAVTDTLQRLAGERQLRWQAGVYVYGMLAPHQPLLVFCAADSETANREAAREAKHLRALVNAAAQPEMTDFQVPSRVVRGDLLLTVATGGDSPAFSRLLRKRLEQEYPPSFAEFLPRLKALREEIKELPGGSKEHQRRWRNALTQCVIDLVRAGQLDRAEEEIRNGIIDAGAES
ncbi:bifunctional precorrin-2 dehydrogenase/sirohydrochlorin ferrochelatase [Selenomonas sp. ND2010]|uniref:precorrin-2 dehydrogenase/sirohydrochlorin ferrochelatase family protein n=1 Tax=Selenomonas sp. ND2010 TaxID=1410618 RepID=UPI00051B89E9|nr:bifunctional precorrin-2 dehydrogenase/sirohydrochlorin ferrochelatase [Selenomonas sp. ND2010]